MHKIIQLDERHEALVVGEPADAEFWSLVELHTWDEEWWFGDEPTPFDGYTWEQVDPAQWLAFVHARLAVPQWRWWVWSDDGEGGQILDPADPDTPDAFRGALVCERPTAEPAKAAGS